jgi:hypothetical protein
VVSRLAALAPQPPSIDRSPQPPGALRSPLNHRERVARTSTTDEESSNDVETAEGVEVEVVVGE